MSEPTYPTEDLEYLKGVVSDALGASDPHNLLVHIEDQLAELLDRPNQ